MRTLCGVLTITALLGLGCGVNQRRGVVPRDAVAGMSSPSWHVQAEPAEAGEDEAQ